MLKAQKRHRPPCKRPEWDLSTRCACPVVIRGTLQGSFVSLSTAKYLPPERARDLEAARDVALLWERAGAPVRPSESALTPTPEAEPLTVAAAVAAYMADSQDRGNADATVYKKRIIFERQLLAFCRGKGIRYLSELDANILREWRAAWKDEALARYKKQGRVIGFFWFCERAGWLARNFAADLTKGLGKIQVKAAETGYFTPAEYAAILDATYAYSDRPSVDKHNSMTLGGERIRALTELMRWTGLRIRDAATLEKHRMEYDGSAGLWRVMIYQKKTGDPVYCPIPPHVAVLLGAVPESQKGNTNERYFFWTGNGNPKSLVANWQRSYRKLFTLTGLKTTDGSAKRCHPHMLRDTFAVEALLSGMRIDEVSTILGHSSVKITERHYMPWVRARQTSLNQSVLASWEKQGITQQQHARPRRAMVIPIQSAVNQ
jgi:integrase